VAGASAQAGSSSAATFGFSATVAIQPTGLSRMRSGPVSPASAYCAASSPVLAGQPPNSIGFTELAGPAIASLGHYPARAAAMASASW
jgi:hypothetical protein